MSIFLPRIACNVHEIVRILLHHSAPEMRYKEDLAGTIPLFCAVESTNNNVCKELLSKDAEAQVILNI